MAEVIKVEEIVEAPMERVWGCFTKPEHIVRWNNASPDWHTPRAENNLVEGGTFNYRMEAKDGSAGFDFGGTYTQVVPHELIAYTMGDGRKVVTTFAQAGKAVLVDVEFEAESENPAEMQQSGGQ